MNNSVILDSSFIIAIYSEIDSQHNKALEFNLKLLNKRIFVTSGVVHEVCNFLFYKIKSPELANKFIGGIVSSKDIKVLESNSYLELINFTNNNKDLKLSYTDISLLFYESFYGYELVTFDQNLLKVREKFYKKRM